MCIRDRWVGGTAGAARGFGGLALDRLYAQVGHESACVFDAGGANRRVELAAVEVRQVAQGDVALVDCVRELPRTDFLGDPLVDRDVAVGLADVVLLL